MRLWLKEAKTKHQEHPEIDLYLLMISTIPTAEEVYNETTGSQTPDELWFWIPPNDLAGSHLASFLNAFQNIPGALGRQFELELVGDDTSQLEEIFTRTFLHMPIKKTKGAVEGTAMAILYYKAGTLNSRKSMISPYLPRVMQ
jgi:hypothetical protein